MEIQDIKPTLLTEERRQYIVERVASVYPITQITGGVAKELCEIAIELMLHIKAVETTNETLLKAIGGDVEQQA